MTSRFQKRPCHWQTRSQILPNQLIFVKNLGNAAKLLLMALNAVPHNWVPIQTDMRQRLGWGRAMMDTAIKECVAAGYMIVKQSRKTEMVRDDKGRVVKGRFSYNIFQWDMVPFTSISLEEDEQECPHNDCEPLMGNPTTGQPTSGNQHLLVLGREDLVEEDTTTPKPSPAEAHAEEESSSSIFGMLKIGKALRDRILRDYSPEQIRVAVKRCIAWTPRQSDEAGLLTCLQRPDEWNDIVTKEAMLEKNRELLRSLEHLDGKVVGPTAITIGKEYIEFASGPKVEAFVTKSSDFKLQVAAWLQKLGLKGVK